MTPKMGEGNLRPIFDVDSRFGGIDATGRGPASDDQQLRPELGGRVGGMELKAA